MYFHVFMNLWGGLIFHVFKFCILCFHVFLFFSCFVVLGSLFAGSSEPLKQCRKKQNRNNT